MKKLLISILSIFALVLAFYSCEDDEVSKKHVYTDAEIAYKDSVEAAKQNVKANYIFQWDITLPCDSVNYRSVEVKTDTSLLLEKVGINTMSELNTAMGTIVSGAQNDNTITFFAISNSTRYDYAGSYTANGFGYWFDANGDVCSWGDNDRLFSELDPLTFTFNIGQHPKHLKKGEKYKIIQAIKKEDYRIAFVINITVGDYYKEVYVDPETPPAGDPVTVEKSYTVTMTHTGDWSDASIVDVKDVLRDAFKMTTYQIHKAIEGGTLVFSGLNADGSVYKDENNNPVSTANAPGHWFAASGNVTTWADTVNLAACFSELQHTKETLQFGIGYHPQNSKVGDTFNFKQVAELNGGKVTFIFTLKL